MKMGNWDTIDVPCVPDWENNLEAQKELEYQALIFLKNKFKDSDITIRKARNAHDFGSYSSFEIDFPDDVVDFDPDEYNEEDNEYEGWRTENEGLEEKKEKLVELYDKVVNEYNLKFEQFL